MNCVVVVLLLIGGILVCASIIPMCQYIYECYVNQERYNIRYYFSIELFNYRLRNRNARPKNINRTIITKEGLEDMWREELRHKLS